MRKKLIVSIGVLVAAGALLTGCNTQVPTNTSTDTSTPTSTPTDANSARQAATAAYTIEMTDFAFSVEEIDAAPGQVITLTVKDVTGNHQFALDEFGIDSGVMSAGESKQFTVNVPADATGKDYTYYCKVAGHKDLGMQGLLKVVVI